jgi:hypothetical protein
MPVALWEVPAARSQGKATTYDNTLFAFSALLVVTSNTLKIQDVQVIRAALKNNKPVVVVRSKADMAVTDLLRQHKCDPASAVEHLRKAFRRNLDLKIGMSAADGLQAYLISSELLSTAASASSTAAISAAAGHSSSGQQHMSSIITLDEVHLQQWVTNTAAQCAGIQEALSSSAQGDPALQPPGMQLARNAMGEEQKAGPHNFHPQVAEHITSSTAGTDELQAPRLVPVGAKHSSVHGTVPEAARCSQAASNNMGSAGRRVQTQQPGGPGRQPSSRPDMQTDCSDNDITAGFRAPSRAGKSSLLGALLGEQDGASPDVDG